MVGKTISHYHIVDKIGEGGMGMVYQARDVKLDRLVALKFLPPNLGADEDLKERFINEAKTASALDHPNIGSIYEIDETPDGKFFIAMAYYEGETIKEKIRHGAISIEDILDYAIQCAEGMTNAHGSHVVHRDLKPANILVTKDGIVKIIDFGLAKLKGGAQLTRSGVSLGTAAYMSPEQAQGADVDERTDIWSLGVVIHEMLTRKLPFEADFEAAMLYLIVNEKPSPVHILRPDVPFQLEEIIARAMHKDRAQRHQRMEDLLNDLKSLRKDIEYGIRITRKPSIAIPLPKMFEGLPARIMLGGGLLIIILGVFIFIKYGINRHHYESHPTIAVLPFKVIGNSELEYLADGIAKDVLLQLSDIPDVTPVSRSTSFLYKNTDMTNQVLSTKLGVRYLLDGYLQQTGSHMFLVCSLYDSTRRKDIWEQRVAYEREGLFGIRNEITSAVAEELGFNSRGLTIRSPNTTPEAYDLYLRGLYHFDKFREADNAISIRYLTEAVGIDSLFTQAIVVLARVQIARYKMGWDQTEEILLKAEENCWKAVHQDSNIAQAYVILSEIIQIKGGNPSERTTLLQKAIDLDKKNAQAYTNLASIFLFEKNDPAKAMFYLKKLQDLDPTDWSNNSDVGVSYAQLKAYPEAIQWFRRSLDLNPANADAWSNLGYTYERSNSYDSAAICYTIALQKDPANPLYYENLITVLHALRSFSGAESLLLKGTQQLPSNHELFYELGVTYKLMGKPSNARRTFSDGLRLVEKKIQRNKSVGSLYADECLFLARLDQKRNAIDAARQAFQLDSMNEYVLLKIARMHAILGEKHELIEWYKRAKTMNPEYDEAYLSTALDFEAFRTDPDLLLVARVN